MAKEQSDLQILDERLKKIRHSVEPDEGGKRVTLGQGFSMMNVAMTIVFSLVGGILIGTIMGLFLDRWLGSSPWLLIVMLLLGTAAGVTTAVRMGKELAGSRSHSVGVLARPVESVWEDDEEEWLHEASKNEAETAKTND